MGYQYQRKLEIWEKALIGVTAKTNIHQAKGARTTAGWRIRKAPMLARTWDSIKKTGRARKRFRNQIGRSAKYWAAHGPVSNITQGIALVIETHCSAFSSLPDGFCGGCYYGVEAHGISIGWAHSQHNVCQTQRNRSHVANTTFANAEK